jgi:hypothetical protein
MDLQPTAGPADQPPTVNTWPVVLRLPEPRHGGELFPPRRALHTQRAATFLYCRTDSGMKTARMIPTQMIV